MTTVTYNSFGLTGAVTVAEGIDPLKVPYVGKRFSVDGSFNKKTKVYGSGVVEIEADHSVSNTYYIRGNNPEFASAWNVAGEVTAFGLAIQKAVERGLTAVTIICDYEGIFRWSLDKDYIVRNQICWGNKMKTPIARRHNNILAYARQNGITTINYIWIYGHTNVPVNDLADKLAKQAAGV